MMLFFTVLGAAALGTFLGNFALFWLLGTLANRQERKKQEELRKLQQGYLEMVERERARIENYAKLES